MRVLDRWRQRRTGPVPGGSRATGGSRPAPVRQDAVIEAALWSQLRQDPNDIAAFHRLAEIVRRHAGEGHDAGDAHRAMDDAVWSLAEELAHSPKAWYPLIELGRLCLRDDREAALRRLGTAAERDPSGQALAAALAMLREERVPGEALNLGMGHWRPREHHLDVGQHLVEAAIECARFAEARRHLDAMGTHPDGEDVERRRAELGPLIERASSAHEPGTPTHGVPVVDLEALRREESAQAQEPAPSPE